VIVAQHQPAAVGDATAMNGGGTARGGGIRSGVRFRLDRGAVALPSRR
jgi:hypothetical protein